MGENKKIIEINTFNNSLFVNNEANRYPKIACKTKQIISHKPKYWNGSPNHLENILKNIANMGIESENTIDELNSKP